MVEKYQEEILIRGAKEHNLKNIDVHLPRFKLVVLTGVSGSGKSSLAFDTLYAEGQRRYVESLSAYARQFIGQMEKPKVDFIGGLSPAIAIEQKAVSKNPRSTVATVTEIYDYLRVLFARVGTPHCPQCGREVRAQSAQEIVAQVAALPVGTQFQVLSPVARNRKGTFQDTFTQARAEGFSRVRVDGEVRSLDEKISLDKQKKHNIELVVDRLAAPDMVEPARGEFVTRLTDSIETALRMSEGMVHIDTGDGVEWLLSDRNACPDCNLSFPELNPAMFSFNSPLGMCPECNGLGTRMEFDPARFVEPEKSLNEGGFRTLGQFGKEAFLRWLQGGAADPRPARRLAGYSLEGPPRSHPPRAHVRRCAHHLEMGEQALQRSKRHHLRGRVQLDQTPLQADPVRMDPSMVYELHELPTLPRLQGKAPASRKCRCHGGQQSH